MPARIANITIYTDASFSQRYEVGTWAVWIKASEFDTIPKAGRIKLPVYSSNEAELAAIGNGIWLATQFFQTKDKRLVVVSDSLYALEVMRGNRQPYSHACKTVYHKVLEWQDKYGFLAKFNKVKAHSNKDGRRSYVNSVVDRLAKTEMGKLLAELEQTKRSA